MSVLAASSRASWCSRSGSRPELDSHEPRDLLAQSLHDGDRLTRRSAGGALDQACDLAELVGHDGREPRALRLPRRDELAERDAKPLEQRVFELRMRLLALLPFHHFDHAPHAKQRIEAWSGKLCQPLRALRRGERLVQRSLVEADGELPGFPAERQVEGAIPAGQHLLGERPRLDLEPFQARRHAEAKLKPPAVDAPHLPMPARLAMDAGAAAKSGHAFQGHALKPCHSRGSRAARDQCYMPSSGDRTRAGTAFDPRRAA